MKNKVRCRICPKGCELAPGELGDCRVRMNRDGIITCLTYNKPCAVQMDPIEKKPLYHFNPGSRILSIGTAGCNLHCSACQNWSISQNNPVSSSILTPNQISRLAQDKGSSAIAYTYAEPLVSYEYTRDCCIASAKQGLRNILVSAAYINPDPLYEICKYIHAANVDLKAFTDPFYKKICDAHLNPVLTALKIMKEAGVWIELTNLIIPTLNDTEKETKELCNWVVQNLGTDTPLHFSRFFPQHQLKYLYPTPSSTIFRACEIAKEAGLNFVYTGNLDDRAGGSTSCPGCGTVLIERSTSQPTVNRLINGTCPSCDRGIPGIWD